MYSFACTYVIIYFLLHSFSGLVGILFQHKKEPAFSAIRMGLSTGFLMGYSSAIILNLKGLLWIAFSLIIISLTTYSILVFKTHTKHQLFPCYTKHEEEDNKEVEASDNSNNQ